MATDDESPERLWIETAYRPEELTPNPLAYAEGVNLQQVILGDVPVWMLLYRAANGHRQPIALLDGETLERINRQTAEALANIHGKDTPR